MAVLKKYDLAGKEVGSVTVNDEFFQSTAPMQMIKDYVIALRANARQWSASTKTRAEVNHSGKKPHPQKGTGRARQGYLGAPQYKGGGRVHAPRPKADQYVRINRKEKRAAIKQIVIDRIQGDRVVVLQDEVLTVPKTKKIADFLRARQVEGKKVLFLGSPGHDYNHFIKSTQNIPSVSFQLLPTMSGYDALVHGHFIVLESAVDQFLALLRGKQ